MMEIVDHERMARHRYPAMILQDVRVIGTQIIMPVRQNIRVGCVPNPPRERDADASEHGQRPERRCLPRPRADLSGERIGDQPARMAERKLCREYSRTIFGVCRPFQKPARRRDARRIGNSQQKPAPEEYWPE